MPVVPRWETPPDMSIAGLIRNISDTGHAMLMATRRARVARVAMFFRIDPETRTALRLWAARDGITLNALLVGIIERALHERR